VWIGSYGIHTKDGIMMELRTHIESRRHANHILTRLNHLVRVLKNIPPEKKFHMGLWANGCGTTACVIGHAAQDPWFRRQGLRLKNTSTGYSDNLSPVFDGAAELYVVERFFKLDYKDSRWLFLPSEYPWMEKEKRHVLRRIRSIIKAVERLKARLP